MRSRRFLTPPLAALLVLASTVAPASGARPGVSAPPGPVGPAVVATAPRQIATGRAASARFKPASARRPSAARSSLAEAGSPPITRVVVVWLENHEVGSVTSTSMPYLYGLSRTYGRATRYYAVTHPSLPNYLAFWSGSTHGVTNDGTYNFRGTSLSNQVTAAGKRWRTYAQNYPSSTGCHTGTSYRGLRDGPGVNGTYVRKHNPAMDFTYVSRTTQCSRIQPLARFTGAANISFVVPNLCNDAHNCSLKTADAFLKAFLPKVFASAYWPNTLLVVTFDEGTTSLGGGGHVFAMVARQGLSGMTSSLTHNHYGLLRTIENVLGLPCLGKACTATPLTEFLPR